MSTKIACEKHHQQAAAGSLKIKQLLAKEMAALDGCGLTTTIEFKFGLCNCPVPMVSTVGKKGARQ